MSDSFDRLLARTERRDTAPAVQCPDADVLAAYLDAGLSPSERSAVEAHAADCARCALQLATIVRLEDQSGHPQHAAPVWWRRLVWLGPAATAVLVAAIYVALPRPSPPPAVATAQRAASTQAAQSSDRQLEAPEREASEPSSSPQNGASVSERAQSRPASLPAPAASAFRSSEESKEAVTRRAQRPEPEADALAKTESRSKVAPASAPVPPRADVAAPAIEHAPVGANAADAFVRTPLVVRAPGARVLWRVVGSQIDRSTDGGHTWSREPAPPAAAIMMGAAPSDDVCWLATPTGQVLRRNEGGTWLDVTPSPARAIARIAATAPSVATIVAIDGTAIRTTDGGQHWKPEPPK